MEVGVHGMWLEKSTLEGTSCHAQRLKRSGKVPLEETTIIFYVVPWGWKRRIICYQWCLCCGVRKCVCMFSSLPPHWISWAWLGWHVSRMLGETPMEYYWRQWISGCNNTGVWLRWPHVSRMLGEILKAVNKWFQQYQTSYCITKQSSTQANFTGGLCRVKKNIINVCTCACSGC